MDNRGKFLDIYKTNITRDGSTKLLEWLEKSDFFVAPSSTRFHGNYEGGLCEHSINVFESIVKLYELYKVKFSEIAEKITMESLAIVSLLHDLCKVNFYKVGSRNVKNEETGQWEKKQIYEVDDKLCMGHGEGSVYIIQSFMKLTREEALAIRWHMSGWDNAVKGGDWSLNGAKTQTPLVTLVSMADLWASDFMEVTI